MVPSDSVASRTAAASTDRLKEAFLDTINRWQKLKRIAVRQRQTKDLALVLSGKALTRQSDAIKWLTTNHRYYEMTPKGVTVDSYEEIVGGQRYAVYAQVKEFSKFMDDSTNQVIKTSDDVYNVNYTMEKVGNEWFINDSSIVTSGTPTSKESVQRLSR